MNDPGHHRYLVGEKSAVIYWLCDDCAMGDVQERVIANLTDSYWEQYYLIDYGDLGSTEDWGSNIPH